MQYEMHEKFVKRILYYWAKMYSATLQIGKMYTKLRRAVIIVILNDEIKDFNEIAQSYMKWRIEKKIIEE